LTTGTRGQVAPDDLVILHRSRVITRSKLAQVTFAGLWREYKAIKVIPLMPIAKQATGHDAPLAHTDKLTAVMGANPRASAALISLPKARLLKSLASGGGSAT
jgi:hypothetical protein